MEDGRRVALLRGPCRFVVLEKLAFVCPTFFRTFQIEGSLLCSLTCVYSCTGLTLGLIGASGLVSEGCLQTFATRHHASNRFSPTCLYSSGRKYPKLTIQPSTYDAGALKSLLFRYLLAGRQDLVLGSWALTYLESPVTQIDRPSVPNTISTMVFLWPYTYTI